MCCWCCCVYKWNYGVFMIIIFYLGIFGINEKWNVRGYVVFMMFEIKICCWFVLNVRVLLMVFLCLVFVVVWVKSWECLWRVVYRWWIWKYGLVVESVWWLRIFCVELWYWVVFKRFIDGFFYWDINWSCFWILS